MEYKKHQLEAIIFLVSKGFSYRDILMMPIHERNNILGMMLENL
jgi:hypothetical protein